jgi:hypothetical protein
MEAFNVGTRDIADAMSDLHLAVAPFLDAKLSVDGKGQALLAAFGDLGTCAVEIASLGAWHARDPIFQDETIVASACARREHGNGGSAGVPMDPSTARSSFASRLSEHCRLAVQTMLRTRDDALRAFMSGGSVSSDEGNSLVSDFVGSSLRTGRIAMASFAFVAGLSSSWSGATFHMAPGAAMAQEWGGPTETFWQIVSTKLVQEGGEDLREDFLEQVDEFYANCAEATGTDVQCSIEIAGVTFDLTSDRYVVTDPTGEDPLAAVQEGGVISFVDLSTGRKLDDSSPDSARRIFDWVSGSDDVVADGLASEGLQQMARNASAASSIN